MQTDDFDYDLPKRLIAQAPLPSREDSRMMVIDRDSGTIRHDNFRNLPNYLSKDDGLVVNDSSVIPARLLGKDPRGQEVEVLLVSEMESGTWTAMVRPGKRVNAGLRIEIIPEVFHAQVLVNLKGGRRLIRLEADRPISEMLERYGHVPLPPYIRRPDEPADRVRYQTVFAAHPGSVAAPTAGLHFDRVVLEAIRPIGVEIISLTLHVGPGTFRPVREKDPRDHVMEAEPYHVSGEAARRINVVRDRGGSVVAVGTTVTRALETVADQDGKVREAKGETRLFIAPPYEFHVIDRLITNFHLPKSTLLMLVAAFVGRELLLEAYREAIREEYRFYSYGDVMLVQ
jgi:S-adenosylmethionine:tRNA ribosyltransferase-isomerase